MMTLAKSEAAMIAGAIGAAAIEAVVPTGFKQVAIKLHRLARQVVPGLRVVQLATIRRDLHDLLITTKKRAWPRGADWVDIAIREIDAALVDIIEDIGRAAGIECSDCGDQCGPNDLEDDEGRPVCEDCFALAEQLI